MSAWTKALCLLLLLCTFQADPVFAQASPSAFTTGYRYDLQRRLTGTISPRPDTTSSIRYAAVRNSYDAIGRLVKVEKGELATWQTGAPSAWTGFTIFQTVDTTYDAMDRKIREIVSAGSERFSITDYSYDDVGRLSCTIVRMDKTKFATPPTTQNPCDAWPTNTDFGPDRITKNAYDAASQLVQVRRGVGTSLEQANVTYSYTNNGKREFIIDAKGNRAKLIYDGFDRQTEWHFPSKTGPAAFDGTDQGTALTTAGQYSASDYEGYGYDANGNRTSLRKRSQQGQPAGSQTILYSYDALNRMTMKDIPGGTAADVYYGYDFRGLQIYARFGASIPLADYASCPGTTSSHANAIITCYDNAGRLTNSTTTMWGSGTSSRRLSYQFDANGNRTLLTYPDSIAFGFEYDSLDRMGKILLGSAGVATVSYNARGERITLSSGGTTNYDYDDISRLKSITHNLAGTTNDVTYCMGTISSGTCAPGYNPASQLLSRTISNDAYAVRGQYNADRGYATNGLNQYMTAGATSPTYDANGNLTFADGTTYQYDIENRLIAASGATSATLIYDPLGRLSSTTSAGVTTRFLYDGDELVAEYSAAGVVTQRYVHGPNTDEPILWYEGAGTSGRRALKADHQGSIVARTDASGNMLGINSYDEWGNPGPGNGGRFAYTGQIILPELKLYHYKARAYSPRLGRFLQTDPVGYDDQINLYAYVGNDPLSRVDPSGKATGTLLKGVTPSFLSCVGNCGVFSSSIRPGDSVANAAPKDGKGKASAPTSNRVDSRKLRREWEAHTGKAWPKDPKTGHNQVLHHIQPLADGGDNSVQNIEPKTQADHIRGHKEAGDFKRWGGRSGKALGIGGVLNAFSGILSGRIRTDTLDNFVSDWIGIPSQQDNIDMNIMNCGAPQCPA